MTERSPDELRDGLVEVALTRLPELQTATGLFLESGRIEGVEESGPGAGLRPTVTVMLGLSRAEEAGLGQPFPLGALRTRVLGELGGADAGVGELGLALWAETRMDGNAIGEIKTHLKRRSASGLARVSVEQLAWTLSGLAESAVLTSEQAGELTDRLREALLARIDPKSGLLRDLPHRLRGAAVPVNSQFHALNALCQLLRSTAGQDQDASLHDAAQRLAAGLLALQRPDGGWPGLVDPARGEAAAWFPALAVTHLGVAPLAFRAAADVGLAGDLKAAVEAGVEWARGDNLLRFDLVHPEERRVDRGIMLRREPGALGRGVSLVGRRIRGRLPEPAAERLIIDPAVSSEDLGWILEAWAGRAPV